MTFVQISAGHTSDIEAMGGLEREWVTEGRRTLSALPRHPEPERTRFVTLAFLDSSESAMQSSELPETQAIAQRVTTLADGLAFSDLDVVDEPPLTDTGPRPARRGAPGRV